MQKQFVYDDICTQRWNSRNLSLQLSSDSYIFSSVQCSRKSLYQVLSSLTSTCDWGITYQVLPIPGQYEKPIPTFISSRRRSLTLSTALSHDCKAFCSVLISHIDYVDVSSVLSKNRFALLASCSQPTKEGGNYNISWENAWSTKVHCM